MKVISPDIEKKIDYIFKDLQQRYAHTKDPWGLDIDKVKETGKLLYPIYNNYFKVRVLGNKELKQSQYMVCSNHTGQIPIDGILISMAFILEMTPPILLRGMVEKFLVKLPVLGNLSAKLGSILGDRQNCDYLLKRGESILVFPEGVRGIAKNTPEFYHLQNFSLGFLRLALKNKTPILPVAVVGAEEMFPLVFNAKNLAKKLLLPALPISLNYFPLPSPIDILIGEEIIPEGKFDPDAPDYELKPLVDEIETAVRNLIDEGLKNRRKFVLADLIQGFK